MNNMFKDAADKKQSGLEKTHATGQAYYEFYKRHPHYFRMLTEAENLLVATTDDVNAAELMKVGHENFKILADAVALGIKDGSIKSDLDPVQTAIFLIQSTRAMILLPPGFDKFLKETNAEKDATYKFTLQILRRLLENTETKKMES